jgi:hypothetical protein
MTIGYQDGLGASARDALAADGRADAAVFLRTFDLGTCSLLAATMSTARIDV